MDFKEFNLDENLLKGISAAGYVTCTPVQEQVLRTALDGSDLYVQSQTGTGKTAAYLVSILQELLCEEKNKGKKVLILLPTRELAVQVEDEAKVLVSGTSLKTFSFFGGVGYDKQIDAVKKGVDIIVGTPGRMIDLEEGHQIDLSNVGFLVVDEADRMFDMGFYPDLRTLLKVLPKTEDRQTMLFSATLNSYVKNLAWEYTRDAKEITIEADNITVDQIDQELFHVSSDEKMKLLIGILKNEKPESVLIFCNTKRSCEVVSKRLSMNELKSEFIIGDLPQSRRQQVLNQFKEGKISILVATDVAARGIDVDSLSMVVNYDLPNEAENYVHRIGRTARAGKTGKAYTFCSEQDVYNLPAIERYIEMPIPAKVADASQMMEDKSSGTYIRTENWNEDYDSEHGGSRKSYHSHNDNRRDSVDRRKNSRPRREHDGYGKRNERHVNKDYTVSDRSSSRSSSGRSYVKEADAEKLQSMSFDDRMKLYKEKYAKSAGQNSGKKFDRNGTPAKKRPQSGTQPAKKAVQKEYPKTNSSVKHYDSAKKGLKSRSLLSRIKSLFGSKNK
ncbi:MAG: DEAD/DEAH box helicase [Treponema sp.]|nr:DEAD/DEAH box helicase [Treponema sp.]